MVFLWLEVGMLFAGGRGCGVYVILRHWCFFVMGVPRGINQCRCLLASKGV